MTAFFLGVIAAIAALTLLIVIVGRHRPHVPQPPADPALLVSQPVAANKAMLLTAAGRLGPARAIIRQGFAYLERQHVGGEHLDPEDVTGEVVGHLLAHHAALVLAGPSPLALACFALARGVDACFTAEHERNQRDACAFALHDVLKPPTKSVWPPLDRLLYQSAFDAAAAWDRRPDQVVDRLLP